MLQDRAAGILLHPTSLPGRNGVGELGKEAFSFVDFLAEAQMRRWQVLPLSPTGYADSPYAAFSSFAGNPLLISLDQLVEDGDLDAADVRPGEELAASRVHYGDVLQWKLPLLRRAATRFLAGRHAETEFEAFCQQQSAWLDDYALFMAVKKSYDQRASEAGKVGGIWNATWDREIAERQPAAVEKWSDLCREEIAIQKAWQFFFFQQWHALKDYANQCGIQVIGDVPIFVALDSVDVWSSPQLFALDKQLQPTLVAGVPPDYFSETGQRWGNPMYDWEAMQRSEFDWWVKRFAGAAALVDILRVDHFRGFEACWSIPAAEPTAVNGQWVKTPGLELFAAVKHRLGDIQILAEDLGLITPEVDALREETGFPGMRVLQFAFDKKEQRSKFYLPHNYEANTVVYTGTHDNNTVNGWFADAALEEQEAARRYLGPPSGAGMEWDFIRLALSSVARLAVIPMQDVLGLGAESRMNVPATTNANWAWRMQADYAAGSHAGRLAELTRLFERA